MTAEPAVRFPRTAAGLVAGLLSAEGEERRARRVELRQEAANHRLATRRAQGLVRLADALAKIGGGSLLSATLLLIVNGQVAFPIVVTAALALFLFLLSTIVMARLDERIALLDHAAELIDAALKETAK